MTQYIDKDKVIEYVKQRLIPTVNHGNIDDWERGADNERINFLSYIDSLPEEPASEDLEEEIKRYFKEEEWIKKPIAEIARHFAHWQHGKDFNDLLMSEMEFPKEFYAKGKDDTMNEMKELLQTEYEKGRYDMREEMTKNTVLETKVMMDCDGDGIETSYEEWLTLENTEIPSLPDNLGLKDGDKVKIIIIKEEQQ